ncbi:MAG TPA: aspartate kinase [Bacteroidia bacterium]|nr:aspartate kinase [Bacteroidia bacterium]
MRVFKFGGASVKDANAVRNVAGILERYRGEKLLIVVSAMGKTTNSLELLAEAWYKQKTDEMWAQYHKVKEFHDAIIADLLEDKKYNVYDEIDNQFVELESLLEQKPEGGYDFIYDQVVSFGEIISTRIVSSYLKENGFSNRWIDARNFIFTTGPHRSANILWEDTSEIITKRLKPIVEKQIVITQGFIGKAPSAFTATLGREGSDYTAAIMAYCLEADSVTIWKDVAGVMNADPKRMPAAVKINELSYNVAIELAYYGATVIHPKTIQPLKSKNIPLYVKSFINPDAEGTVVSTAAHDETKLPFYIFKSNQAVVKISTKDFSFIVEDNLKNIFSILSDCRITMSLMQNSAISFSLCVNNDEEKLEALKKALNQQFNIEITSNTELVTIRNYTDTVLHEILGDRQPLLEQRTANVLQFVV